MIADLKSPKCESHDNPTYNVEQPHSRPQVNPICLYTDSFLFQDEDVPEYDIPNVCEFQEACLNNFS